jgi:hypothetical protein
MANWQRRLDISEIWKQGEERTITYQELAAGIATALRALKPFNDEELDFEREDVADEFEGLSQDSTASVAAFDDVMDRLYDWADTPMGGGEFPYRKRACWVDRWGYHKGESAA